MKSKKEEIRGALFLGVLCSVAYLAVYIARNILSTVTPQMINSGVTESYIGNLSSLYLAFYAIGQLINGVLGDKIKARYMISFGLGLAGVTNILLCYLINVPNVALIVYPLTGFFLAMIYGPMVKVVSENMNMVYASRCSLGYTFSSYFGSPIAGVMASLFVSQTVFKVSSGILILMAVVFFICMLYAEKNGIVIYRRKEKGDKTKSSIKTLIKREIIKYTLVSIVTGVIRTTVVFWMPTYFTQNLGFSEKQSATLFTVTTLIISLTAFITIYIYEKLNRRRNLTMIIMFAISFLSFVGMFAIKQPIINIALLVIGIMSANGASSIMWSIYCPSLSDTGMVSTATGYLDFISYSAAAVSSTIFANAVSDIGWNKLILIWAGLMLLGLIVVIPYLKIKKLKHHS